MITKDNNTSKDISNKKEIEEMCADFSRTLDPLDWLKYPFITFGNEEFQLKDITEKEILNVIRKAKKNQHLVQMVLVIQICFEKIQNQKFFVFFLSKFSKQK